MSNFTPEKLQEILHSAFKAFVGSMVENGIGPREALADLEMHESSVTDWIECHIRERQDPQPPPSPIQEPLPHSELPPLPDGWTWHRDGDGEWMAVHKLLRVYKASWGLGFCESVSMAPRGSSGRGLLGIPVRVAVAVAIANRIPHEPSSEPLADEWQWKRPHGQQTKIKGGERDTEDP